MEIKIRPNGKIDVRIGGRKVAALDSRLNLLAGRYLTDGEMAEVRELLAR